MVLASSCAPSDGDGESFPSLESIRRIPSACEACPTSAPTRIAPQSQATHPPTEESITIASALLTPSITRPVYLSRKLVNEDFLVKRTSQNILIDLRARPGSRPVGAAVPPMTRAFSRQ